MSRALLADAHLVDEEFARMVARVDLAVTARVEPFSDPEPDEEQAPEAAPAEKEKEAAPEKETEEDRR